MGSSSRGEWKKITTQPGSVCMGVCVCVLTNNVGHNEHTHTHSCRHPGQQVAPQPLTRTNIWQLPHPASCCRMLPAAAAAAAVLPLLLFVFWSMLSTGSHKCRARVLSLCLCLLLLSGPCWARRVQRLLADFPKKGQQSEKKNEAKTKATKHENGQRKVQTLQAATKVK